MARSRPPFRSRLILSHQMELEAWLASAALSDIREHLTDLHGMLPEELDELSCGRWSENGKSIESCERCNYFALAIVTVGITERPELRKVNEPRS